jgi:hypothetical protein
MIQAAAVLFGILLIGSVATAQEVSPDRPSVGTGAGIIPPGFFQLESGVEYSRRSRAASLPELRVGTEILLRAGIIEGLEAQVLIEPVTVLTNGTTESGFGDVTLGVKYRILAPGEEGWPPAVSVLPFVKVPIARDPIGSEHVDVGAIAIGTFSLPWELSSDLNAGVLALGDRQGFLVQALASIGVSRPITGRLSVYGELFFRTREERDGRDALGADAGVVFMLTKRVALDVAVETGLLGDGNDWAVRAGISVLLGAPRGR